MIKLLPLISLMMVVGCVVLADPSAPAQPNQVITSAEASEEQQSSETDNETIVDNETFDDSAPAAVTRLSLANAATALRTPSAIVLTTAGNSQARVISPIQHTILPPETIPLPITIATRPGLRTVIAPETITIHEPTIAKVGEVVQQIPTAVSHQSQTIVHQHARVVTPIVAPAVRTITSQVLRAYHTPLVYATQPQIVRVLRATGTIKQ